MVNVGPNLGKYTQFFLKLQHTTARILSWGNKYNGMSVKAFEPCSTVFISFCPHANLAAKKPFPKGQDSILN